MSYFVSYVFTHPAASQAEYHNAIVSMDKKLTQESIAKLESDLSKKHPCTNPYNDRVRCPKVTILQLVKLDE